MNSRRPIVLGIVLSLAAAVAGCQSVPFWRKAGPPTPPVTVTDPQWTAKPTAADLSRLHPVEARRSGTSGSATIQCVVQDDGGLRPCTVVSETPAKSGFGEAALKAAPLYLMATSTPEGRPLRGASVSVSVNFTLAPA